MVTGGVCQEIGFQERFGPRRAAKKGPWDDSYCLSKNFQAEQWLMEIVLR